MQNAEVSKKLKKTLNGILDNLQVEKEKYVRDPERNFTRRRSPLTFKGTMEVILNLQGKPLADELRDALSSAPKTPYASAFVRARDKIKPTAFIDAFDTFNAKTKYYDDKTYKGYHLFAVDGTDINLAYDPNADTCVKPKNSKPYNQIHLTAFYDILNQTYKDLVIQPKPSYNEQKACKELVNKHVLPPRSIIIGDRNFGGHSLFEHCNRNNVYYLIRVKEGFSALTKSIPMMTVDTIKKVEIRTGQTKEDRIAYQEGKAVHALANSKYGKQKKKVTWEFESPYSITLRIVRFPISEDSYETIITNIPKSVFDMEDIKELYRMRWKIETSFMELKYATSLINLHTVKYDSVIQEIYAKLLIYNFSMRVATRINIEKKDNNKHSYQINWTQAIHIIFEFLKDRYNGSVEDAIAKNISAVRPGRRDRRKAVIRKGFVPFVYRVA